MKIECFPLDEQFGKGPQSGQTLLLRITTAEGIVGLGEAFLPAAMGRDALPAALEYLRKSAAVLADAYPQNLNGIDELLRSLSTGSKDGAEPGRAALDMALHDIIGRTRGVPVSTVLGGAYHSSLGLHGRIEAGEPLDLPAGTTAISIAVGPQALRTPAEVSGNWIAGVLDQVSPSVQIYLDGGQHFDNAALARSYVEALMTRRFYQNVGLVQPLHVLDLLGHAQLREALPIPVVLEASVTSAEAMSQILRLEAADHIILDLDRVGGLREAMRISNICESAAIGISPASLARTAVGAAASCHFAAVLREPYPIHIGDFLAQRDTPWASGLDVADGFATVSDGPGLGVVIHADRLPVPVALN